MTTFTGSNESGAQGGTASQSQSMGASRSGSAIDPDLETTATKSQFDERFTGQASEIGEKGKWSGPKYDGTFGRKAGLQRARSVIRPFQSEECTVEVAASA
jgi:hypothetical protein